MLIQGFYDIGTETMYSSDTVRVALRNSFFPYSLVDQTKTLINKNNFTSKFYFNNAPSGNYYLQSIHRNSIETWSSQPLAFTRNINTNYDLTTSLNKAYGNNMIQVDNAPLRFGIYAGDENQDGNVDVTDVIDIFNDMNLLVKGYVKTDVNGDYIVDTTDLLLAYNNSNNSVSVIAP